MSYAVSAALQRAIYQALSSDPALSASVGSAIFDKLPPGELPSLYVVLGQEKVRDASDASGAGAWHEISVSVVTDHAGFSGAKQVGAEISDALINQPLTLDRGTLVAMNFLKATAARVGSGDTRRIDLTFRARVCDS